MLKDRLQAVQSVRDAFLTAERAADYAATTTVACVAAMLNARSDANLPLDTGLDVIDRLMDGALRAVQHRRVLFETHPLLAAIPAEIGLSERMWGASGDCPEMHATAAPPASISLVA